MEGVETMDRKELTKYIVAFTYGDGYLDSDKSKRYSRFQANNLELNRDYVEWRANILSKLTEVTIKEVKDIRKDYNRQKVLSTCTRQHPLYSKVRSRLYLNGRKVIDPHYLKLFDWETLAILYMDDGSLRCVKQNYKGKEYRNYYPNIATCNLTYYDNLALKNIIKEKLNIEFNVNRHSTNKNGEQTYILVLQANSRDKFFDGIKPFILPSFEYKINPNAELS